MARILGLEVPREMDDRAESNAAPQRTAVLGLDPREDGPRPDQGVARGGGEACEVAQDPFMVG